MLHAFLFWHEKNINLQPNSTRIPKVENLRKDFARKRWTQNNGRVSDTTTSTSNNGNHHHQHHQQHQQTTKSPYAKSGAMKNRDSSPSLIVMTLEETVRNRSGPPSAGNDRGNSSGQTGVIILPTQTMHHCLREIPEIYHISALFDPPTMGNSMTPVKWV